MYKYILSGLVVGFLACQSSQTPPETALTAVSNFETSKWCFKQGADYPYRAALYPKILYNDTLRRSSEAHILALLGPPDRREGVYLYYTIAQKKIALWPLKTQTLVITLSRDSTPHRIQLHG